MIPIHDPKTCLTCAKWRSSRALEAPPRFPVKVKVALAWLFVAALVGGGYWLAERYRW